MNSVKPKILVVEDDRIDQMAFDRFMHQEDLPYDYVMAGSVAEARGILSADHFDVAVTDYLLGDGTAFDLFADLTDIPMIIVTGAGSEEIAVKAIEMGAYDYLIKDREGHYLKTLPITVDNAVNRKRTEAELRQYREHLEDLVKIRTIELQKEIDERKRAQEELKKAHDELEIRVQARTAELRKANEELDRASRMKDEFLAIMSHELRTPLNVVLGISESLQEGGAGPYGPVNERQLRAVRMVAENGRRLLELINDMLDLSRIFADRMELNMAPLLVEMVCQSSLQAITSKIQKKRLSVSFSFDHSVGVIQADERCVKQILGHLLGNALKFTPEGGAIGLEVKGDRNQQVVHFMVWDTGIGIAPEDRERVFLPFVQLDASLSRRYEGAGIGLTLVQHLVKLHGGMISVTSEVGKGSRFTISLPWKPE
jgi:signal transduction histidine kinase